MIEPSSENYAKCREITRQIDKRLRKIERDTAFSSSPKSTTDHSDFKDLVEMGDVIVPYLFHVMTHDGASWPILLLLRKLVPLANPIKEEHRGKFYHIIHDWLGWYLTSSYREKDDIYHGLVGDESSAVE